MAGIMAVIFAGIAVLLAVQLVRVYLQIKEWNRQMEGTQPGSNLRLGTSVRSQVFQNFCRQMNRRLQELQESCLRTEKSAEELKYTISCVSHDIRTPLTGALGYLELAQRSGEPLKVQGYMEIVRSRLKELEDLLEELFLYTKMANSGFELETSQVCTYTILCQVLAGFYGQLTQADMEPRLVFQQENRKVTAEPEAMRRVFGNLINNALVHGSRYLEITQEGPALIFSNEVEHPDKIDCSRLFDRFYKADPARHRTSSGLGLSIVQQLMEKMGGSVQASLDKNRLSIKCLFYDGVD